jgi:hypothetical protein
MQSNRTNTVDFIAIVEEKFELLRKSIPPSSTLEINKAMKRIEQLLSAIKEISDISINTPEFLELQRAVADVEIDILRDRANDLWHRHDTDSQAFYNENELHNLLESLEVKLQRAKEFSKKNPGSFSPEAIDLTEHKLNAARTAIDETTTFTKDSTEFQELMDAAFKLFQSNRTAPFLSSSSSPSANPFHFVNNAKLPASMANTRFDTNFILGLVTSATVVGGLCLIYLLIFQRKNFVKITSHAASASHYIFGGGIQKGSTFLENMRLRIFTAPLPVAETPLVPEDLEKQQISQNTHRH